MATARKQTCKRTFLKHKMDEELRMSQEVAQGVQEVIEFARKKGNHQAVKLGKKMAKQVKKDRKKTQRYLFKMHEKNFCNLGCKGTILEPSGAATQLPAVMRKEFAKNPALLEYHTNRRKELFGKNKHQQVLSDSFYANADPKYVKQLKQEGAISYCTPSDNRITTATTTTVFKLNRDKKGGRSRKKRTKAR